VTQEIQKSPKVNVLVSDTTMRF